MTASRFTVDEVQTLRQHGIVLFANRVIFNAQPPIDPAVVAHVESFCEGPIPAELRELWNLTAGGSLSYELTMTLSGQAEAISFTELFYSGSSAYNTLEGWLERQLEFEEELCDEKGIPFCGKASFLPFGGFEYCDRMYINVSPGDGYGEVVAWKMGPPPAWKHRLHEDSSSVVAASLSGTFAELYTAVDPRTAADEYAAGLPLLEYVNIRRDEHGLDAQLADRLMDHYVESALLEWQSFLADGTLRSHAVRLSVALLHAVHSDDAALIKSIAALGETFDQPLQGSAQPMVVALGFGAFAVVTALVELGAPVDKYAFSEVRDPLPLSVAEALIAGGAYVTGEAAIHILECNTPDTATSRGQFTPASRSFAGSSWKMPRLRQSRNFAPRWRTLEPKAGAAETASKNASAASRTSPYSYVRLGLQGAVASSG
jgi:hypothetical protein